MTRRGWIPLGALLALVLCLPLLASAAAPPAPAPAGESYVVKKGDTLWGIAKSLFDDPVLWPRLWEANPFVADPNRIYPGDTLALPGKRLSQPPPPAPVAAPPVPPAEPPAPAKAPEPPPAPAPAPVAAAPAPPPPGPPSPVSQHHVNCAPGVLAEGGLSRVSLGQIVKGGLNQTLFAPLDDLYLGLGVGRAAQPGDRLAVVRDGVRVIHPTTKASLGRILHTIGILEVQEAQGAILRAKVVESCNDIRLGDQVIPFVQPPHPATMETIPASVSAEGMIVASLFGEQMVGTHQYVFVDLGAERGVKAGDLFRAHRLSPPVVGATQQQVYTLPPEGLGEGIFVRVFPGVAAAILIASHKELQMGDRVVLTRQVKP